jgi:2,4-dienoyl-CoA reductase-like NADH-dependent reductase (Old Yellow Enzyme family)
MSFDTLFSPIKIGPHELRNRIVHVATVTALGKDRKVTDRLINYHRARAEGGAAMIVTELMNVHPTSSGAPILVSAHDEANLDGFTRWAEAVEGAGCRLIGQLGHIGRQQLWGLESVPRGASAQPESLYWNAARPFTEDEIPDIVAGYANTAERFKRAGFSGVELHGAHGYLIAQFLSPACNDRTDGYGGSFEGRTRFMREVLAAVRAACGSDFIVGIKLPADERIPGGIDPDEATRIAAAAAGEDVLDYMSFSQGAFGHNFDTHLPDMHYPPRPFLPLHTRMRAAGGGLPVIGLGRIETAEAAETALAEDACDLVGFSRLLISDAAWPNKTRTGRSKDVRLCTYCNYCWGEIHAGKPIRCFQNPELVSEGEADWQPPPANERKRVVVVGAGLAGLEAAWIAATRGHDVTVFSTSDTVGGAARLEARLPGRADVAHTMAFQHAHAVDAGADFRLGVTATVADVRACQPDAIVLATGSTMRRPPALAADAEAVDLRSAVETLLATDGPPASGTAVLLDMNQTLPVYAAAELLAQRFARVVLLTPAPEIARFVNLMSRMGVDRRLAHLEIDVRRMTEPTALEGGRLTYRHIITGAESTIDDVALLTYVTPRIARDDLATDLEGLGVPVHLAGDCTLARDPASAVHDGHRIGLAL